MILYFFFLRIIFKPHCFCIFFFKNHIQTTLLISFVLVITIFVPINYFICNLNILTNKA